MSLSVASSIIIDLMLLNDAASETNESEVVRFARRIQVAAKASGANTIAEHARSLENLVLLGSSTRDLTKAIDRLMVLSETEFSETPVGGS